MILSFEIALQFRQGAQSWSLELTDPTLGYFVDGYRIDEVQPFSADVLPRNEICRPENRQMFRDRLP
jgi:hypothetical protein